MSRRLKRFVVLGLLALAAAGAFAIASLPYRPLVHGTTAGEVERLAAWLEVQPGTLVADLGAGDGTAKAGLSNVSVVKGAASQTNIPDACCDALFSRAVYHHLTDPTRINADVFRALRPGARLVIIDFEPGGIMNWITRPQTSDRHGGHGTPRETVVKEVTAAGFQLIRGPQSWRGRLYAVLFRRP